MASATRPLFADTWKVKLQSTVLKGPAGRRTSYWSFERPRIMNFTAYRVRGIKKLQLKPSGKWVVTRYKVRQGCYRATYVHRLKPTKVHDMEGERVVSRAMVRYFNSWRTCSGDSFRSWFNGTARRESTPQKGGAEIFYDSPDGCDPALVEHSANEDGSFFEWDGAFSYRWTFSDGGSSTEAEPRHVYPGPGNHTATVLIREIDGSVAKGTQTVEVPEPEDCSN